jgi:methylmalonyl-CoA/ethylmalonyl-CoA epimerase
VSAHEPSGVASVLRRPLHHIGFIVPDLDRAIGQWVSIYGAGPFFKLEHVTFETCESHGGEARWDHSAAFGQWGPIGLELQQFHELVPSELLELMTAGHRQGLNHVGIAVDDAEAERARLESAGMPEYLHAGFAEIDLSFHDARDLLGCSVEVHQAGPMLDTFWSTVADSGRDWDGRDPVRSF